MRLSSAAFIGWPVRFHSSHYLFSLCSCRTGQLTSVELLHVADTGWRLCVLLPYSLLPCCWILKGKLSLPQQPHLFSMHVHNPVLLPYTAVCFRSQFRFNPQTVLLVNSICSVELLNLSLSYMPTTSLESFFFWPSQSIWKLECYYIKCFSDLNILKNV